MQHIINHFKKVDPILAAVIKHMDPIFVLSRDKYFEHLCEIIIQQQLSEKAGETIFQRFVTLFLKHKANPKLLLQLNDQQIRNIGTSNMKVNYLKNLARYFIAHETTFQKLHTLSDAQVIAELTKIKGVGQWSAEMFLMFSLGREDVFSYGDLGLRKAIQKLYKLKKQPTQKQAEKISRKWSPYKTYACRILWNSL